MPFEQKTVMEQRLELVIVASQQGANISELCRRYGISRKLCYKWLNRYKELGEQGLKDISRKPKGSPFQTDKAVEKTILSLRRQNPEWGARKLKVLLEQRYPGKVPSSSTIGAILQRNGLIIPQRSQQHVPVQRFEYEQPNELWQMDFKGGFRMLDKSSCYPLTITDDYSRFNICLCACTNQQSLTVKEQLTAIFRKYGIPDMILTDNGSPWGTTGSSNMDGEMSLSALEIWLLRLSVKVIHGRPYHPQTQGKEERFHRTFKTELLQYEQFKNIRHCQLRFDHWRNKYNLERPHQAIGFKTPGQLYKHSDKNFAEVLPPIEYNCGDQIRKVDEKGCINYKGNVFRIGKGLTKQLIAVRPTVIENEYEVYFCNKKIRDIAILK